MSETELSSQVVERAIELLSSRRSFDDIMDDTLRITDAARPSEIWSTIASVDRNADVRALGNWSLDKLSEHPIRLG